MGDQKNFEKHYLDIKQNIGQKCTWLSVLFALDYFFKLNGFVTLRNDFEFNYLNIKLAIYNSKVDIYLLIKCTKNTYEIVLL